MAFTQSPPLSNNPMIPNNYLILQTTFRSEENATVVLTDHIWGFCEEVEVTFWGGESQHGQQKQKQLKYK